MQPILGAYCSDRTRLCHVSNTCFSNSSDKTRRATTTSEMRRRCNKNEEAGSETPFSNLPEPATAQCARRHAGEIIPRLWVGDIRSVSFIEDLLRISTAFEKEPTNAIVTVISVMSSANLLQYVSDLLTEKQKHLQQSRYPRNEPLKNHFEAQCNTSLTKEENKCIATNSRENECSKADMNGAPSSCSNAAEVNPSMGSVRIHHIKVPLRDSLEADLMTVLQETLTSIDAALGVSLDKMPRLQGHETVPSKPNDDSITTTSCTGDNESGICLVHCAKGMSRSVSVVIGYLLSRYPSDFATFDAALDRVRQVRPSAMPNVKFALDLRKYAGDLHIEQQK